MDENAVENLKFHQDTVATDANSPLHLIREKEIEISGRMLSAKRQADEIVADARKRGAAVVGSAHEDGSALARQLDEQLREQVQREIVTVRAQAEKDASALEATISQRRAQAVSFVLKTVLGD